MNIPYGKQHISDEDIEAVVSVLRSDFLTQGPNIERFEKAFAKYVDAKYAVAVSNGTAALHLCALALDVKKNDKVITTPITFAASANCIKYCSGEVVFADINPDNYLIDIDKVKKIISESEKNYSGMIIVDFAGMPANLEEFRNLADQYGLWIIEDACHAPGGFFTDSSGKKQLCGNGKFADLAIFSFHPVKHIATGEGGMITTNDQKLYDKLLRLRTHGITRNSNTFLNSPYFANGVDAEVYPAWYMEMHELGYNYRITDFQAALGLSQLSRIEEGTNRRQDIARKYDHSFKNVDGIRTDVLHDIEGHAHHLYIIETPHRLELYNYLRGNGIYSQVHYIPLHLMPYYKSFGWKEGDLPIAEEYYKHCLSLPMYPSLSDEELNFVIDKVKDFFS